MVFAFFPAALMRSYDFSTKGALAESALTTLQTQRDGTAILFCFSPPQAILRCQATAPQNDGIRVTEVLFYELDGRIISCNDSGQVDDSHGKGSWTRNADDELVLDDHFCKRKKRWGKIQKRYNPGVKWVTNANDRILPMLSMHSLTFRRISSLELSPECVTPRNSTSAATLAFPSTGSTISRCTGHRVTVSVPRGETSYPETDSLMVDFPWQFCPMTWIRRKHEIR